MNISWKSALYIPNILSISRILLIPVISWLLVRDTIDSNLWAAMLLVAAGITDMLDGFLARLLNQQTDLGKLLDPLADKLFAASFVIVLLLIRDFPLWFLILIIGKDVVIAAGGYLVMKKHDIVMESNLAGKYAFASQVLLIISYYIRFPFGCWFFTITTLALIALTLFSYWHKFQLRIKGRGEDTAWSPWMNRLFFMLRIWFVLLGFVLVMAHAWVWLYESPFSSKAAVKPAVFHQEELAERYAPVLIIPGATPPPVNAGVFFDGAQFKAGSRFFLGSFDEAIPASTALERNDAYIAISRTAVGSSESISCHWYSMKLPDNSLDLHVVTAYWFFFIDQNIPVYRQGIWRAVLVYSDAENEPQYVLTTREWQLDVKRWDEIELLNNQPTIHVGRQSRGFAFSSGEFDLSLCPARILRPFTDEAAEGRHYHHDVEYHLEPFNDQLSWYAWRGLWGGPSPGGDLGPRWWNPKNTRITLFERPLHALRLMLNDQPSAR